MPHRKSVFDAVQAALLNSECNPHEAVHQAMRAVAQFADAEVIGPGDDEDYRYRVFEGYAIDGWDARPRPS